MSAIRSQWFQPGEGIAREVITADIQRYLGQDALVKPGEHEGVQGYWVTAYRNLTSQMVVDLKADSQRWRAEQGRGSYQESTIHRQRQHWGPTSDQSSSSVPAYSPAPAPTFQQPPQPSRQNYTPAQQQHPQYADPAYTYSPPAGYSQSATSAYLPPTYTPPAGQQPRSQPTYSYTGQPGPGQEQHAQYQQTHQGYAYPQPSSASPAQYPAPPPQQPSVPPGYYQASDGRHYPINPQPQQPANHGARRR